MSGLSKADLENILGEVFAPWIQDMGLIVGEPSDTGGQFQMAENPRLVRGAGDQPGVICGQAIAAAADTVSVIALCHLNQRLRNLTTVDMTTHFMRPLMPGVVDITVEAVSNGRRMAVTRVEFRAQGTEKLAAISTLTFAYLED